MQKPSRLKTSAAAVFCKACSPPELFAYHPDARMASLNPLTRELVFKIVFYGPGLGGKTTTLQYIHGATKAEHRGLLAGC